MHCTDAERCQYSNKVHFTWALVHPKPIYNFENFEVHSLTRSKEVDKLKSHRQSDLQKVNEVHRAQYSTTTCTICEIQ